MNAPHEKLITVLRTRREYCRAMLELARLQQTFIDQDRTQDLLQLITQKQRIISGLSDMADEFGGLASHWKKVRDTLAPADRKECDAILAQSEQLLAQTLQHESQGTEALSARQERTRQELQQLGELAQSSPSEYTNSPAPQFLDVSR